MDSIKNETFTNIAYYDNQACNLQTAWGIISRNFYVKLTRIIIANIGMVRNGYISYHNLMNLMVNSIFIITKQDFIEGRSI